MLKYDTFLMDLPKDAAKESSGFLKVPALALWELKGFTGDFEKGDIVELSIRGVVFATFSGEMLTQNGKFAPLNKTVISTRRIKMTVKAKETIVFQRIATLKFNEVAT